jgi:hypothetical protein
LDFSPLFMAYALSGAAGIRSALTMLIVSMAVSAGYLHPDPHFAWVGSSWFMLLAFAATVVEFFADKVPALDHMLHAIHLALAPVVGALAAGSGDSGAPLLGIVLAMLGAGNALFVHSARAAVRVGSTATTAGLANPVISLVEDGIAVFFIVVAILLPGLAALLLVLLMVWIVSMINRFRTFRQRG